MKVFFSSGPAEYNKLYTMWLRNTLIVDFPDNKYHVHLKGTAEADEYCSDFKGFVDDRFAWIPLHSGDVEKDSKSPMISTFSDEEDDPDKVMHVFHITVGAFVVHLVGENSAYSSKQATSTSWRMGRRNMPSLHQIGIRKPLRREHRTKEGKTYSLEDICSI